MSSRRGGELTCEEGLEGDREELGDRTWATNAGATDEALIGTPSSSGCRWEISMLSLPALLGILTGGGRGPKSDSDSSLEVTRIAVSRGADMLSTRRPLFCDASNVRDGFCGAGA